MLHFPLYTFKKEAVIFSTTATLLKATILAHLRELNSDFLSKTTCFFMKSIEFR